MKYTIYNAEGEDVSVESNADSVVLRTPGAEPVWLSVDEFREFRKAVGYVWQEVEQG